MSVFLLATGVQAGEKRFRLAAQSGLSETGFLKYLLPRFSLKTGVRIEIVASFDDADAAFAADGSGAAVFERGGAVWRFEIIGGNAHAARFADWLQSDVGRRTIAGYRVDGVQLFTPPEILAQATDAGPVVGDAELGLQLATQNCARCHVVSEETRMGTIGSTPSFFVLRTFADWEGRFRSFFARKPHPAFTQIEGVTDPFPVDRPSPIYPLQITLDDLDAIVAYVAQVEPADLGAPIQHQ